MVRIHVGQPLFPAINERFPISDTFLTQETPGSGEPIMKWPYKVRHRKNGPIPRPNLQAQGPSQGPPQPLSVLSRDVDGGGYNAWPRRSGVSLVKAGRRNLPRDSSRIWPKAPQSPLYPQAKPGALSPPATHSTPFGANREVPSPWFRPSPNILPPSAVWASARCPEAVAGFMGTVATVKRMDLSAAVEEFITARETKTKTKGGRRAQLSASYTYNTWLWLRNFAAEFTGQALCDFAKEHLDLYFSNKKRADLAPKSRNHIRATLTMFFRWAIKNDYLSSGHRLLEAAGMERETAMEMCGR